MNPTAVSTLPIALARARLRTLSLCALAGAVLCAAACARVPRTRHLPEYVRGVHVPLFKNNTFEPDVEEDLTRAVQEALAEDGRLLVAREKEADLVIEGLLTAYEVRAVNFEDDEFPWMSEILVEAQITAYDPYDYDRQYPLGTWKKINAKHTYSSNTRRTLRYTDVEEKKRALTQLARQIVAALIYTPPDDLDKIEERRAEERETARGRLGQIRFRSAYAPQ